MKKSNWIILGVLLVAAIFFLWLYYALQFNLVDNPLDLVLAIVWWVIIAVACLGIHKAEQVRQERARTAYITFHPLVDEADAQDAQEQTDDASEAQAQAQAQAAGYTAVSGSAYVQSVANKDAAAGANGAAADAQTADGQEETEQPRAHIYLRETGLLPVPDEKNLTEALRDQLADIVYSFDTKDFPNKDRVKFDLIVRSKKFEFEDDNQEDQNAQAGQDVQDAQDSLGSENAQADGDGLNATAVQAGQAAQAAQAVGAAQAGQAAGPAQGSQASQPAQAGQVLAAEGQTELDTTAAANADDAQANNAAAANDEENRTNKVVKTWEGNVSVVSRPDDDPITFKDVEELTIILRSLSLEVFNARITPEQAAEQATNSPVSKANEPQGTAQAQTFATAG